MNQQYTVVATLVDERTIVLSLETKSSLSRTERRVVSRLLVNPVEGTQRLLQCSSINTTQISTVLVTKTEAATMAGLPGVYFAMSDVGAGTLAVRGPKGTTTLMRAWQEFVRRKYPELDVRDVESEEAKRAKFEKHQGFAVLSVTLKKALTNNSNVEVGGFCVWCAAEKAAAGHAAESSSEEDEAAEEDSTGENEVEGSSSSSGTEGEDEDQMADDSKMETESDHPLCNGSLSSSTMCYVVQSHDGTGRIAIVDCRNDADLESIASSPHLTFRCDQHRPKMIIHLASEELVQSGSYQNWIRRTQVEKHVYSVMSRRSQLSRFNASNSLLRSLAIDAPSFYAVPDVHESDAGKLPITFISIGPSGSFEDQPALAKGSSEDLEVVPEREVDPNEIMVDDEHETASATVRPTKQIRMDDDDYPRVVFLGTGAAKPSTLRGLSCCQVWLSPTRSVLLDAGEDTINQMARYEISRSLPRFSSIDSVEMIWISHHHLDHHGGLAGIIEIFFQRNRKKLVIFAPASVRQFLSRAFPPKFADVFPCEDVAAKYTSIKCSSGRVEHCFDAHAIALDVTSQIRLMYTGDTRPCISRLVRQLAIMGTSSSPAPVLVLIHEATFETALVEEAKKKKHSTVEEALNVGRAMKARLLLLTHFSQRYPKYIRTEADEAGLARMRNPMLVLQAHDFLDVNLAHFVSNLEKFASDVQELKKALLRMDASATTKSKMDTEVEEI